MHLQNTEKVTGLATKHERILDFIKNLEIGYKISVRQIAKALQVSEGTAYRAIKDAENQGYVSTIERVGTIRIEKKHKGNIEKLTYAEVVSIVDGQVLGGRNGLHKTLNRFVIGAMKLEAMKRYIEAGGLLIVGNRDQAHEYALQSGAAVLITGGFETREEVKELANTLELPIISTSYDTFTVAAMINRAIYDRLIKKEIIHVSDILIGYKDTSFLYNDSKVSDWQRLNKETGHSRYPVIDHQKRIQGMVTAKDILRYSDDVPIERVMTKSPITVSETTTVASAAHRMIWEGIECLPVVTHSQELIGIITRQDVLKALQMAQRQPQIGETIDDIITDQLTEVRGQKYQFTVRPQMTNHLGALSYGTTTTIVTTVAEKILGKQKKGDLVVENVTLYFLKPVQLESVIDIHPKVLEVTRRYGKVDIELYHEEHIVGKAFLIAQFIDRY
ncbi:putative transcriptional regulator [Pullulanibacillus pueri]|uniref:Thioesterase n=1 Tax=Pullulanibacillus pueri TaxID=1437324 RepID=A0A8J2ZYE5_9BACL|nr:DRTGG domain-containing protein [Pullulanibacillus pueri]MBM7683488.1 putative transcriptional regulator [Pullulanibacillus pueri]GGH86717.1 thioesterase [Pullulanibacillus pueri]